MQISKNRIYEILETAKKGDKPSHIFDISIICIISINLIALTLGTVNSIYDKIPSLFTYIETISVLIFLIEYLLRIWSCNINEHYSKSYSGRLKFIFSPLLIIDLLAIIPFFLPILGLEDLRFLWTIRFLARAVRIGRYFSGFTTLGKVIKLRIYELLTVLIVLIILLILTSSLIYYAENPAQPEQYSSIPESMWWTMITLTTVGYGTVIPITFIGKILTGIIAIIGIGLFALPAGILGSGFIEAIETTKIDETFCSNCNKKIIKSDEFIYWI